MSEVWKCPDCAEDAPQGVTVCPYCGYAAASAKAPAAGAVDVASTAPAKAPATRTVRYGHCPSCGRSEWEGAVAGRCVSCGAELQSLQVVEVPLATGSEAQWASATGTTPRPAVVAAAAAAPQQAAAKVDQVPAKAATLRPAAAPVRGAANVRPGAASRASVVSESNGDGPPAAVPDAIALLRQLAALRDEGIITSDDFETKKAEILRRL